MIYLTCVLHISHNQDSSIYLISTRWSSLLGGGGGLGVGGKFWQHARCASAHITFAAFGKPSGGGGGRVLSDSTLHKEMSK